jgi:hypothetical protein
MNQLGSHAIALGAGMGGLIAARKLADHYQRVTILKRDGLPAEPEPRKGVPDGRHAHGLLARRRKALEEMLPGLTNELIEAEAIVVDTLGDTINYGVYLAKGRSGPQSILSSRPILESAIIDIPWQIAAGSDLGHPRLAHLQTPVGRFMNWYIGKVHKAAAGDASVGEAFLRVANLMNAPAMLFSPKILSKVLVGNLKRSPQILRHATAFERTVRQAG